MIVVEQVTKYYGSHCAVRDLDFRIAEGECIGFLGLNGAGKSTTLKLLSCLLLPTSGRVTIRGVDAERHPHEIRKFIGYLPDTPPLYREMTVREYLRYAAKLRGVSDKIESRVDEVVRTCNLEQAKDRPIAALSHGFRQRVGIAQALVHNPALLILDEPIQGLDPVQIVEMREMIRTLRGKHTILLSSHILSEIEQTCDRILVMHEGRITAQGTEVELAKRFGGDADVVTLEIEVATDEASARAALESEALGQTRVMHAEPTGTRLGEHAVLRVRVAVPVDRRAEVARVLVGQGIPLLELRVAAGALEDIFLRLTQAKGAAPVSKAVAVNAPTHEGSAAS